VCNFGDKKEMVQDKLVISWQGVVAQTCNPSYLGVRDQEDCNFMVAWAKNL
jgi:hypothetical protein